MKQPCPRSTDTWAATNGSATNTHANATKYDKMLLETAFPFTNDVISVRITLQLATLRVTHSCDGATKASVRTCVFAGGWTHKHACT